MLTTITRNNWFKLEWTKTCPLNNKSMYRPYIHGPIRITDMVSSIDKIEKQYRYAWFIDIYFRYKMLRIRLLQL